MYQFTVINKNYGNVGKTIINHPPNDLFTIGGIFLTILSHAWFLTLLYPHYMNLINLNYGYDISSNHGNYGISIW